MYLRTSILLHILIVSCLKKDRLKQVNTDLPNSTIDRTKVMEPDSSESIAKDIKVLVNDLKDKKIDHPGLSQMLNELKNNKVEDIKGNIESEEFIEANIALEIEENENDKESPSKIEGFLEKLSSEESLFITGGTIVFVSSIQFFHRLKSWYNALAGYKRLRAKNVKTQGKINTFFNFAEKNKSILSKNFNKSFSDITIQDLRAVESKNLSRNIRNWRKDLLEYMSNKKIEELDKKPLKYILEKNLDELKSLNQLDNIIYNKKLNSYFSQIHKFPSSSNIRDHLIEKVGSTISEAQKLAENYENIMKKNNLTPEKDVISTSYSNRVNQVFLYDKFVQAQLKKVKNPVKISTPLPKPTILSGAIRIIAGLSYANFSLEDSSRENSKILNKISKLEERIWRLHFN